MAGVPCFIIKRAPLLLGSLKTVEGVDERWTWRFLETLPPLALPLLRPFVATLLTRTTTTAATATTIPNGARRDESKKAPRQGSPARAKTRDLI